MTSQELLEAEISVLLLRHGRKKLLHALAHRMQLSEEYLISEISQLLRADYSAAVKKKKAVSPPNFEIDSLLPRDSEKSEIVRRVFLQYENRTFLPELRDVKRFLDRHGIRNQLLKSRTSARATIIQLLLSLDASELDRISKSSISETKSSSSLGLISDEILGRNRAEVKEKNQ